MGEFAGLREGFRLCPFGRLKAGKAFAFAKASAGQFDPSPSSGQASSLQASQRTQKKAGSLLTLPWFLTIQYWAGS